MPKRSTTPLDKADTTTNKRRRTKRPSALGQKGSNISAIDCPSPRLPSNSTSTMPGKHKNELPAQQLLPAAAAAPHDRHQKQHRRVSEAVSDVSSVDHSIQGRSRANSDDCFPIPSHVTTRGCSGQSSSFPTTSVVRPVSSTGSGSGIFFEGRELPPTSPVNTTEIETGKHDDKKVVIPTFFDTNKVANTIDDASTTTTSDQLGVVYDLVPSSLRSRATAFTPLLPSPVLLNRDVASYLLNEQGHADASNDNSSIDGGASIDAIQSKSSSKISKRAIQSEKKTTKLAKKKSELVTLILRLDQYAIHMKTQRLRGYLKKRAAERRAARRAENERNSGRTAHACRLSTGGGNTAISGSANRSAAASPVAGVMGAAVSQTGVELQLPRPMSSYTSITTTEPPGCLPGAVSYDTATDATTNAATATAASYEHPSTLTESAPLSACSQDVVDAALALTCCLTSTRTTYHIS